MTNTWIDRIGWMCAGAMAIANAAGAQCLEWNSRFFVPGTVRASGTDRVQALAVFDDGSGPALYVGGLFTHAGGAFAPSIARWDGTTWTGLSGHEVEIQCIAVYDDGSGPALYVGGQFSFIDSVPANHVAKWDGTSWSALGLGMNDDVSTLIVHDDGSGAELYAGGAFSTADGASANRIAKWNGTSWSSLGLGLGGGIASSSAVYDDGSGAALFVGGSFTIAGGSSANRVAKWDGSTWSALGAGLQGSGSATEGAAMVVHDDGSGARLHVGGTFVTAGGVTANNVAAWDGTNWTAHGLGTDGVVRALAVYDDGSGAALHAGGAFASAGTAIANQTARWDGSDWSADGGGMDGQTVYALAAFDDGSGSRLIAGGQFFTADAKLTNHVAAWDGSQWDSVERGGLGVWRGARALAAYDDGSGLDLYVGGDFATGIARSDGAIWSAVGGGTTNLVGFGVHSLAAHDDGSGAALFAGGVFTDAGGVPANFIAKWDGTSWSALGSGMASAGIPRVRALAAFDDGGGAALYAGGDFTTAGGGSANRIAKWDGSSWSALGSGMGTSNTSVHSLIVFDDGGGSTLYAGGTFTSAGGSSANRIAKWNGLAWSALGTGLQGPPGLIAANAMVLFDDGGGSALFVGGRFATAGPTAVNNVAKWDGSAWSALGTGVDADVFAMSVFDDGSGSALYVAGAFVNAGGSSANHIAKWDGSSWSALPSEVDDDVLALFVFEDGDDGAPDLYAGGTFTQAGGIPSNAVGQWHGCPPGEAYCFGDSLDPVVTALCPCGNFGDAGHGCANSNASLGGGKLTASGTTSPNTVEFTCTGVNNNTLCTFLRSANHDPQAAVFGDGINCVNPPLVRFGQQNAGQGGNPPFTVTVPAPTQLPGTTRHYTVQYRNPTGGFCLPALFNASNGYTISW